MHTPCPQVPEHATGWGDRVRVVSRHVGLSLSPSRAMTPAIFFLVFQSQFWSLRTVLEGNQDESIQRIGPQGTFRKIL